MRSRVTVKKSYETAKDLRRAVNAYFDEADEVTAPYTIAGLCLHIGYTRDMFLRNSHSTELGEILSQARLLIEQQLETRLATSGKPTGAIFALKNLGWSDRSFLDVGVSGGNSDSPEALKWTVEVIAPGEPRNIKGQVPKLKSANGQPSYRPPAFTDITATTTKRIEDMEMFS